MNSEEINLFLAKELMEWKIGEIDEDNVDLWLSYGALYLPTTRQFLKQWDPYHDITQALGDGNLKTIVGKMSKLGWEFCVDNEDINLMKKGWCAEFLIWNHKEIKYDITEHGSTPSEAICLAAVEALQKSKKE